MNTLKGKDRRGDGAALGKTNPLLKRAAAIAALVSSMALSACGDSASEDRFRPDVDGGGNADVMAPELVDVEIDTRDQIDANTDVETSDVDAASQDLETTPDATMDADAVVTDVPADGNAELDMVQACDVGISVPSETRVGAVSTTENVMSFNLDSGPKQVPIGELPVELSLSESWASDTPVTATLKQNGILVATASLSAGTGTRTVVFQPSTPIVLGASGFSNDTFWVEVDTATIISEDSGAIERLEAVVDTSGIVSSEAINWGASEVQVTTIY